MSPTLRTVRRLLAVLVVASLALSGCASDAPTDPPAPGADLGPRDPGAPDLRPALDAETCADLGPVRDLALPTDLGRPPADLAAPDQGPPPDLSTAPDAATDSGGVGDLGAAADLGADLSADLGVPACRALSGEPQLDEYGGDARVQLDATGYFRVQKLCDRWWLVSPLGTPLYGAGVNTVGPRGSTGRESGRQPYGEAVAARYPDDAAWADAAVARLRSWGFAMSGSWSQTDLLCARMPCSPILGLALADWEHGVLSDYFDPAWEEAAFARAAQIVGPWAEEPKVVGWFLDNELRWGPDWRGGATLLQVWLARGPEAPGKAVAVDLLLAELGGEAGVAQFLGQAEVPRADLLAQLTGWDALGPNRGAEAARLTDLFLALAAERYFSVAAAAVRAVDSHHLILGNREVSVMTRAAVYEEAARYVDVLSINAYVFRPGVAEAAMGLSGGLDPAGGFAALHALVDLPILISEFGFRAADAGLPNSWPPIYPTLPDQAARAAAFAEYARGVQGVPWVVGYHWFTWVDQPVEGRFDGEDNNWGVVSLEDEPYVELTGVMGVVNREVFGFLRVP